MFEPFVNNVRNKTNVCRNRRYRGLFRGKKQKLFIILLLLNLGAILLLPIFNFQAKLLLLLIAFFLYKYVNSNRTWKRWLGKTITTWFMILNSLSPFMGLAFTSAITNTYNYNQTNTYHKVSCATVDCPKKLINDILKRHRKQTRAGFLQKFKKAAPQKIKTGLNVLSQLTVGSLAVAHAFKRLEAIPYYWHRLTPEARVIELVTIYTETAAGFMVFYRPFLDPSDIEIKLFSSPVLYGIIAVSAAPDFVFKREMLADYALELRDQGIELRTAIFDLKNYKNTLSAAYDENRILKKGSEEIKNSLKTCIQEKEILTLKHINTEKLTNKLETNLTEKGKLIQDLLNEISWVKTQSLKKKGLDQLMDTLVVNDLDMDVLP